MKGRVTEKDERGPGLDYLCHVLVEGLPLLLSFCVCSYIKSVKRSPVSTSSLPELLTLLHGYFKL